MSKQTCGRLAGATDETEKSKKKKLCPMSLNLVDEDIILRCPESEDCPWWCDEQKAVISTDIRGNLLQRAIPAQCAIKRIAEKG